MTTLRNKKGNENDDTRTGAERRQTRRHDLETQGILVERWDAKRSNGEILGEIVDLSAGGLRIRTQQRDGIRPENHIRVRLALPAYAGICPFVDTSSQEPQPKNEWIGWMSVARVQNLNDQKMDVAGRLEDMEEMDRGMLGLYLSTQPLAA